MPKSDLFKEYPYIRAWGEMLGSDRSYILAQIDRAKADGAPRTAIYQQSGYDIHGHFVRGKWNTVEEITAAQTRHWFTSRGLMTPDWKVPEGV